MPTAQRHLHNAREHLHQLLQALARVDRASKAKAEAYDILQHLTQAADHAADTGAALLAALEALEARGPDYITPEPSTAAPMPRRTDPPYSPG